MSIDRNVVLYGTSEAQALLRSVQLGPLSFVYTADSIRRICWHGTELVRAIAWPIRDESWGTFQPNILDERVEEVDGRFSANLKFEVGNGQLTNVLSIQAAENGTLSFELTMTPAGGPFATNRAGFTVLHPIKGIAGSGVQVTHSGGAVEKTVFPRLISPGQPVFDIHGLRYGLDGRSVDIAFDGDIFEMEDQRNWSDASYKTYCVPLVFPFTYEIVRPKTQSIKVLLSGGAAGQVAAHSDSGAQILQSEETAPAIGLAVEPAWIGNDGVIATCGPQHLVARIGPETDDTFLADLAEVSTGRELDLEFVIANGSDPKTVLIEARDKVAQFGLTPTRVIALPHGYLGSHQPSGPWPSGPTPAQVVVASREVFSDTEIGGGMLTNFTEFNRCPPNPADCDFVTHGNSAIVHAGDDLSVCETLEALPQIFESAENHSKGKAYRLGLMSLGMRTNPYGAELAHNPTQIRHTMAHEDPRQRGLFAAAWAIGALAATKGHQVASLCLAAPTGPFGIAYSKQDYPQPYFDDTKDAAVYPIFHVIKAAAEMAKRPLLQIQGLPDGVHGYGAGSSLMIANVSAETKAVHFSAPGWAVILDSGAFAAATHDPNWRSTASPHETKELRLEGFAIAFVEI